MLHVTVKTENAGVRKAWYIDCVREAGQTLALVVFKNNDSERFFTEVPVGKVCLDTSFRNVPYPIVDSAANINRSLKKKS